MGGGAMPAEGGGKKGKRSLDTSINVVPAIDLLSCCITFLLYTAIWTQISRLQVQQLGTGAPDPTTIEEREKAIVVTLTVGERGMSLAVGETSYDIPARGRSPEGVVEQDFKDLAKRLTDVKGAFPGQGGIVVTAEDTVPYGDLVRVIDECNAAGLAQVTVSGV